MCGKRSNLSVYYGGSAAQTPIALGTNFPVALNTGYELILTNVYNSTNTVYYRVTNINTGNFAEGTLTGTAGTAIPSSSTFMHPTLWRTNNTAAVAVGFDVISVYMETDR
jgi:hypothetical protein